MSREPETRPPAPAKLLDEADPKAKSRFVKGALLAWIPFLVFAVPFLREAFRGISGPKATGLAAVAGGLSEGLVYLGFAALVLSEVSAIFLLFRAFPRMRGIRSFFSIVSIGLGALALALMGMYIRLGWFHR